MRNERLAFYELKIGALLSAALSSIALTSCSDSPVGQVVDGTDLRAELVLDGLDYPVHLAAPPLDSRLFIVEQEGRIRIFEPEGAILDEPSLDLSGSVTCCGERGLLSLAFHPDYAANGFFYVTYTDLEGDVRLERYRVSNDPNRADPESDRLVLEVPHPGYPEHNGGLSVFGPDGMLYLGLGDGGFSGNPLGHGQDRSTLLGSILRIDVDGGDPYRVPTGQSLRGHIWGAG